MSQETKEQLLAAEQHACALELAEAIAARRDCEASLADLPNYPDGALPKAVGIARARGLMKVFERESKARQKLAAAFAKAGPDAT